MKFIKDSRTILKAHDIVNVSPDRKRSDSNFHINTSEMRDPRGDPMETPIPGGDTVLPFEFTLIRFLKH